MTDTPDSYPKTNLRKVPGWSIQGLVEMAEPYTTERYGDYVDFAIKLDAPGTFVDKDGVEFTSDRISIGEKAIGVGPNSGVIAQLKRLNYTPDSVRGAYLQFSVKPEKPKDKDPKRFFFNIDPVPGRTTLPTSLPNPELTRKRADAQAAYAAAVGFLHGDVGQKIQEIVALTGGTFDINAAVDTLLREENR